MELLRAQCSLEAIMLGNEGLWAVLLRHAPAPEHREMELVVGSQRIRRNKVTSLFQCCRPLF